VRGAIDRAALSEPAQLFPSGGLLEGRLLGALSKSEVHHQDVDRARALLVEAGYPEGRGLRPLRVRGRYGIAEMLRTQLHEIGIEIEFVEDVRGAIDPRIERYASGWTGPVYDGRDPGPTLMSIAHELAPLVPELREVDPARMLLEPRLEPRVELYKAFHRNLLASFRVLPYGHVNPQRSSDVWLVREGVEGMVDEATGQIVDLRLEQVWRRT